MSQKILITGAGRGLGLSLARIFLTRGFTVYALNRENTAGLAGLKKEFPSAFDWVKADVRWTAEVEAAMRKIAKLTPSIDILINNAAVHLELGITDDFSSIDPEKVLATCNVNSVGPLRVIAAFMPLVLASERKLVVTISSEAGSITDAWRTKEYGYCMSKAAVNMMSRILANRVRKDGVKVLAMHPGWFSSDMGGKEAPITPDQAAANVAETILRPWTLDDPIYVDSTGKQMHW
jgi:NAD(P)-dependent dehydrogenase (short-subunit alcohol dehydrogenase family)